MPYKVLFVERAPSELVSIEKVFRQIAADLSDEFEPSFQKMPYGSRLFDTIRNLIFFRKQEADVYHITGHVHYIALLFPVQNSILSVMDVRFLYRPRGLRRFLLKKLYLDLPLRRLKYITAISEHTRNEILELTNCDRNKIRTIELPLISNFTNPRKKEFDQECPTILQVGTMHNKNIPNLAVALRGLNCKLRITGRLDDEQVESLRENGIDYRNVFNLSDGEMRAEYEQADTVVYCSTLEGFGLPIIEGQSMMTPVVTSNLSPMKEVAGNGASLVDPFDPKSIRAGIDRIIDDRNYREFLVKEGGENIKRFAPETITRRYEELYREVINANGGQPNSA